jgi:hypothetical protein
MPGSVTLTSKTVWWRQVLEYLEFANKSAPRKKITIKKKLDGKE